VSARVPPADRRERRGHVDPAASPSKPAGDPVTPGELIAAPSPDRLDRISVCLLECDAAADSLAWVRAARA